MKALIALVFAANTAYAAGSPLPKPPPTQYGSQCGLLDSFDSDSYEEVGQSIEVVAGATFTDLEKTQILKAAQEFAGQMDEASPSALEDAIKYLNESSEGGEVYLQTNLVKGTEYTVLLYYPGGNPVGVIYKKGTTVEVAQIQDSDVVCSAAR